LIFNRGTLSGPKFPNTKDFSFYHKEVYLYNVIKKERSLALGRFDLQSVPRLPQSGEVASEMESNHKIDSCDGAIENQETIASPEKVGGDYRDDFTPS
jgi:hypothetical protein